VHGGEQRNGLGIIRPHWQIDHRSGRLVQE
jgi:hypothetical protein